MRKISGVCLVSLMAAIALLVLPGCYTKFATLDQAVVRDSLSASKASAAKDTIPNREREICYWTRDLFGRPQLRCYSTYFDDDWDRYRSFPWWYGDFHYYSMDTPPCHCPYHSYYHPNCRYCWEYCDRSYHYCRDCQDNNSQYGNSGSAAPPPSRGFSGSSGTSRGGSGRSPGNPGGFAGPLPSQSTLPKQTPADTTKPAAPAPSPQPSGSYTHPDTTIPAPLPQHPPTRRFGGRR